VPNTLLLADDSVTIQRVIELTFADEDVQVVTVGNGKDAIERVQHDRPDIVLADIGMPERNGYEVAAFVKGNPATSHIPVVLLTGAFEPIDEGRAKSVGCDGVLVKPFEPQLVISRVKDLLAGKKPAGMWGAAPAAQGPVRPAAVPEPAVKPAAPASSDPLEAYFDRLDAAFAGSSPSAPAPPGPPADPFAAVAPPSQAPKREAMPVARGGDAPAKPASSSGDPFADWDPDLEGDPSRAAVEPPIAFPQRAAASAIPPAAVSPAQAVRQPHAAAAPPPSAPAAVAEPAAAGSHAPAAPISLPSLVDAFAALLSAEARTGLTPSTAAPSAQTTAQIQSAPITDEVIEDITKRVLARLTDQSRPTILDVAERLVREEIERLKQSDR
jgi:CheY-like chemotaxis protein